MAKDQTHEFARTGCPKCGDTDFSSAKPASFAFTNDRICTRCRTRYAIPTPLWAAAMAVALGGLVLVTCVSMIIFERIHPGPGSNFWRWVLVAAFMGFPALGFGVNKLKNPDKGSRILGIEPRPPVKYGCPQCGANYESDGELGGKTDTCPHCGTNIRVPAS